MTYCNKIQANEIYKMNETQLNETLDKCENCPRYSICDTVALMNDELKLKQGECLKCPHCEHYQDFSDCPDLFVDGDDYSPQEQVELLHELWTKGYNIVTCGHCGQVFIHRI